MNFLVCIKQVPASNKVAVDPDTGVLRRNGVDSKMNPYDLYALETAFRLREQVSGSITVLTMGPPQAESVLREALAMGADEAVLLSDRQFGGADVLATSRTLAQGIECIGAFDIILCGKQTTDGDTAQVGPALAEWLGLPSVCDIRRFNKVSQESLVVEMDMQEALELVEVKFPCLLSVCKDIFVPRLPSYVRMKQIKNKQVKLLTLADLADKTADNYGLSGSPTKVQRIFPPQHDVNHEIWHESSNILATKLFAVLTTKKFI